MEPDDLPPLLDAAESLFMALLGTFEGDKEDEEDEEDPEGFGGVIPIFPIRNEALADLRTPTAMPQHPPRQPIFVVRTG
jgi:hypothetical protein